MFEIIWTATSVFPVPGGPTIMVRPGCMPARIASTWVGVKGTELRFGSECGYGPSERETF